MKSKHEFLKRLSRLSEKNNPKTLWKLYHIWKRSMFRFWRVIKIKLRKKFDRVSTGQIASDNRKRKAPAQPSERLSKLYHKKI